MCTPAFYNAMPQGQQKPEPQTEDGSQPPQFSPSGGEPLLVNRQPKPVAPYGYMVRYIDGQWQIVPDFSIGRKDDRSLSEYNNFTTGSGGGSRPGVGGGGGSGGIGSG